MLAIGANSFDAPYLPPPTSITLPFIVMTFLVRECYGSPKISIKFVKIRQNSLKFTLKECYDKVLNEEF
jgi:hypothetical protein